MLEVAARYKASGSFLARACRTMNVPRPPRGYCGQSRGWSVAATAGAATGTAMGPHRQVS